MSDSPLERAKPDKGDLGATATEYGILAGFVALALIVGIQIFGSALNDYFGTLTQWFNDTL